MKILMAFYTIGIISYSLGQSWKFEVDPRMIALLGEKLANFLALEDIVLGFIGYALYLLFILAIPSRSKWAPKLIMWWHAITIVLAIGMAGIMVNAVLGTQLANNGAIAAVFGGVFALPVIAATIIIVYVYKNRSYFNR